MKIETRAEILDILKMPDEEYLSDIAPAARELHRTQGGNKLTGTAMLGFTNVCKNQCLYCGMRASNSKLPRYRIEPEEALRSIAAAHEQGFRRVFLVAGEDPKYGFEKLLELAAGAKKLGMTRVSMACGEFERSQYEELYAAGVDEYVLKFEFSDPAVCDRLKPSTTFKKRFAAAGYIKEAGMDLASGNIVDWPGQTVEQLADDIELMKKLGISWAPVIPYLPVPGTPLALEGGPGSQMKNLKEISILRLMMPGVNLTAQQPGKNPADGLASVDGNLAALNAGANFLFADLLPTPQAQAFRVVENRITLGLDHMHKMADLAGMEFSF